MGSTNYDNVFHLVQALSAICAIAAAVYWLRSALVNTPDGFAVHVSKPDGFMGQPLGGGPLHATFIGTAHSSDFQALAEALKKQSKLSAIGAGFASGAAIFQVIGMLESLFQS